MHVCSARTQPLAGTDLYIEPSPWQGSVVPLLVALAATRRDRLLLHEFCRGNKTPYKKSKSVDSWIAILLLFWNCHSASTAITTTVTVTATVTVARSVARDASSVVVAFLGALLATHGPR